MDEKRLVKVSKYLSKHLRHQPERLGLSLETGGWVSVEDLLQACARLNFPLSLDELREVVERNDKKRFSFDPDGERIRANQGHSVDVDLQLEKKTPPARLFHGTATRNVAMIRERGLLKMARHHVHLSIDTETARKVGSRHGKPVIFEINTAAMLAGGFEFFVSANGVWLVESVPPEFLKVL
ncbi:MAG TPA: RNA 2'-phosphotransferase [Pyrinomonadaceae bacterium]|nr:RNA 2'-phosphotransferase [Pyrinomonadaceae bacterium]